MIDPVKWPTVDCHLALVSVCAYDDALPPRAG